MKPPPASAPLLAVYGPKDERIAELRKTLLEPFGATKKGNVLEFNPKAPKTSAEIYNAIIESDKMPDNLKDAARFILQNQDHFKFEKPLLTSTHNNAKIQAVLDRIEQQAKL